MSNSDIIALSAVIIAALALLSTLWQGYLTRKHNKLSVKPLLHLNLGTLNGLFIKLQSLGLGPALITKVVIISDGKRYENPSKDPYPEILSYLTTANYKYLFNMPVVGSSYLPGSEINLLSLECENFSFEQKKELEAFHEQLYFELHYTSFYGGKELVCKG
ncbi:hypothetical protein ORJ04_22585 [Rheinheimera baltica]|uniref:Uncharacterized protein n=1 Tax=Rheinheimera baltica TaxID=67576 RepID=A0ABT9I5T2_9GAMM|nr:hypothetical protein [Rheinheimera baltica]MDP5138737.1 hypothetical protein [Rheinheimera baltica]MDP5150181.1 hypothetical protein [Rheinheimera baltica]